MDVVINATIPSRDSDEAVFEQRAAGGSLTVAVIGLGYTGLPLAHAFAETGFDVHGVDVDTAKLALLRRRRSYLPDLSDEQLRATADRMRLSETPHPAAESDVVVMCVPTPVTDDHQPDLTYVDTALASMAPLIRAGTLLVLQSTMPPGTTHRWAHRLATETGLTLGESIFVACAPERVNPANRDGWTVTNTPRVVGGVTPACTRRATAVLRSIGMDVLPVSGATVAEMSKLLENSARLVNISLSNEMADLCHRLGVPVDEVVRAAATKPFGYLPHWPGPGIGGECIPVDPLFLVAEAARQSISLPVIEAAHRHASARPAKVVDRVQQIVARNGTTLARSRVLVLGVAYKPNVPDLRNAPALAIIEGLLAGGADADYCDPWVPRIEVAGRPMNSLDARLLDIAGYDCVVLVTAHDELRAGIRWDLATAVLDTVYAVRGGPNIETL